MNASAIAQLPLRNWASRFEHGRVEVTGELPASVDVAVGDRELSVMAGRIAVGLWFTGGPEPTLRRVEVVGAREGVRWSRRGVGDEGVWVEGVAVASSTTHVGLVARTVIDALSDVRIEAEAWPAGPLELRVSRGVRLDLAEGCALRVRGATTGTASNLVLCEPLEIRFGGQGISLSHHQLRRLSRLAAMRISVATLHPDGSVRLHGAAPRGLDLALRGGLVTASARFSDLVRQSPRFSRVRAFLKP